MDLNAVKSSGGRDRPARLVHDSGILAVVILEPVTVQPLRPLDELNPPPGPNHLLNLVQLDLVGVQDTVLHLDADITPRDREPVPFAALQLISLDRDDRFQFLDLIEKVAGSGVLSRDHWNGIGE